MIVYIRFQLTNSKVSVLVNGERFMLFHKGDIT